LELGDVGSRVRYWRKRRGMTRQLFADLLGRSPSWVDKVETGDRRLDRLSVLDRIAEVLNVRLHVLLDDHEFNLHAQCADPAEVAAIRAALQRYDPAVGPSQAPDTRLDLGRLQRQVSYGWLAFQASDYAALGQILADLLTDTQRAEAELPSGERQGQSAVSLLTQTYQIIASTTRKLGHFDLEWIAADRCIAAAERTGDPLLLGGASFRLVNAFLDNNGAPAALVVARGAADRLAAALPSGQPGAYSLYGHLLLQGAMCAAAAENASGVQHFLREAKDAAARLGSDRNDFYTAFGPTNVLIHEVAALVELREWAPAIDVAAQIDPTRFAALPRERRANHLLGVARAHSLGGERDEALCALLEAEGLAPSEVRCRPAAHDLVTDLVRRARNRPSLNLQRLAARAGVPV
jgi:transcriptional regulator with XRE-family HTH domain